AEWQDVEVECTYAVAKRFQVHGMMNEPKIFLGLRLAGIVPITQVGAGQLAKEELVLALEGQFLEALAVFKPQLQAARFGVGQDLLERLFDAFQEWFLPSLAFFIQLFTEFVISGS